MTAFGHRKPIGLTTYFLYAFCLGPKSWYSQKRTKKPTYIYRFPSWSFRRWTGAWSMRTLRALISLSTGAAGSTALRFLIAGVVCTTAVRLQHNSNRNPRLHRTCDENATQHRKCGGQHEEGDTTLLAITANCWNDVLPSYLRDVQENWALSLCVRPLFFLKFLA